MGLAESVCQRTLSLTNHALPPPLCGQEQRTGPDLQPTDDRADNSVLWPQAIRCFLQRTSIREGSAALHLVATAADSPPTPYRSPLAA